MGQYFEAKCFKVLAQLIPLRCIAQKRRTAALIITLLPNMERMCGYRYNLHPALQGSGRKNCCPDDEGSVCLWAQSEKAGGRVCLSL